MGAPRTHMGFPMFESIDPIGSEAERLLPDADAVFGALAHASRRHILVVLHVRGSEMTGGGAARFGRSWPTTTRWLPRVSCS